MLITAFVAGAAVFLMMLFFAYMLLPRVGRAWASGQKSGVERAGLGPATAITQK